jgi:hypothetical protein
LEADVSVLGDYAVFVFWTEMLYHWNLKSLDYDA